MSADSKFTLVLDSSLQPAWLAHILDDIPVPIGVFDPDGLLVLANRLYYDSAPELRAIPLALDGDTRDEHVFPCVRLLADVASPARSAIDVRLERFVEHSSSAIIIADLASGRVEYFSPAARRIWSPHCTPASVAEWDASIHSEDRGEATTRRALVLEKERCQRFQYRIVDLGGDTTRLVRETCFLMPSEDDTNTIGSIVEDVSPEIPVYLLQPPGARDSALFTALQRITTRITTFSSHEELLHLANVLNPGCIVIDLRTAPSTPDAVLGLLRLRPTELRVVLIGNENTAAPDIIRALKAGATDYLLEPLNGESLAHAIQRSCRSLLNGLGARLDGGLNREELLANLSRREREVLFGLIDGGTNKSIARSLKISPRTVETHRASLMQRMNVRTLTQLLRLAHDAGLNNARHARV